MCVISVKLHSLRTLGRHVRSEGHVRNVSFRMRRETLPLPLSILPVRPRRSGIICCFCQAVLARHFIVYGIWKACAFSCFHSEVHDHWGCPRAWQMRWWWCRRTLAPKGRRTLATRGLKKVRPPWTKRNPWMKTCWIVSCRSVGQRRIL